MGSRHHCASHQAPRQLSVHQRKEAPRTAEGWLVLSFLSSVSVPYRLSGRMAHQLVSSLLVSSLPSPI